MRSRVFRIVVVVVVIVAAVAGFTLWTRSQERRYEAAEQAHRDGDCARALSEYRAVADGGRWTRSGLVGQAEQRAVECEAVQLATGSAQAGDFAAAITAFEEHQRQYPGGLAAPVVAERLADARQALGAERLIRAAQLTDEALASGQSAAFTAALDEYVLVATEGSGTAAAGEVPPGIERLGQGALALASTGRHCDAASVLLELAGRPDVESAGLAAQATAALPRTLFDCGVARHAGSDHVGALETFDTLATRFPDDPLNVEARPTAIAAEVAAARAAAGELPPPVAVGTTGSESVTVELINDSPDALEILYSGPGTDEIEVEACGSCEYYSFVEPVAGCPDAGAPTVTITLPAGAYSFLVRSRSESGTTPFVGSWDLGTGTAYSSCFYIIQSFG